MHQSLKKEIESIAARVTWHMARHHGWGQWTPVEVVFTNGLTNEERNIAENKLLPEIRSGNVYHLQYRSDTLRLDGRKRREIAYFLRDIGEYSELQIEATVSRFRGFNETEPPDVTYIK